MGFVFCKEDISGARSCSKYNNVRRKSARARPHLEVGCALEGRRRLRAALRRVPRLVELLQAAAALPGVAADVAAPPRRPCMHGRRCGGAALQMQDMHACAWALGAAAHGMHYGDVAAGTLRRH